MGLAYFVGAARLQGSFQGLFYFMSGPIRRSRAVKAACLTKFAARLAKAHRRRAGAGKEKLIGSEQLGTKQRFFGYQCALESSMVGFDHYKALEPEVEAVTLAELRRRRRTFFATALWFWQLVRRKSGGSGEEY